MKVLKNKDTLKFNPYQLARLEDLLQNGKAFISDARFNDKNFCDKLMAYKGPEVDTAWFFNHMNSLDGVNKTASANSITLDSEQEELLFLKYNYIKKTINSIASLNVGDAYDRMLELDDVSIAVRDQLVGANLGLVLKIAKSNTFPCVDFTEALSEGHICLLDAVEGMNVSKGGKFSTYFTTIFTRALIRVNKSNMKISNSSVEYDSTLHDAPEEDNSENLEFLDLISQFISEDSDMLDPDELFVLRKKYVEGLTLGEIGEYYTPVKTKGQVFYVEKKARLKIKDALTSML